MLRTLWADEAGFILSAELVLVMTIGVLALVVGLNAVAKSINQELFDLASAFGTISQSFFVSGFLNEHCNAGFATNGNGHGGGFGFQDTTDECDCAVLLTPGSNGNGRIKIGRSFGPGSGGIE